MIAVVDKQEKGLFKFDIPDRVDSLSIRETAQETAGFINYVSGDFHLTSTSPLKNTSTDGTDPGADIPMVRQMTSNTILGN